MLTIMTEEGLYIRRKINGEETKIPITEDEFEEIAYLYNERMILDAIHETMSNNPDAIAINDEQIDILMRGKDSGEKLESILHEIGKEEVRIRKTIFPCILTAALIKAEKNNYEIKDGEEDFDFSTQFNDDYDEFEEDDDFDEVYDNVFSDDDFEYK